MAFDPVLLATQSQARAAWLQAIGSVIGLIVAIGVPWRLASKADRVRKAEATRKAMAMGLVVRQQLWRIRWPLTMILEQWPVGKDMPLAINHSDGGWQEIFDQFSLPEGLKEFYGHLHELDGAAEAAILAIANAERSKILLNSIEIDMHTTGGERQAELEKELRPVMVTCLEQTNEAIHFIDEMYS